MKTYKALSGFEQVLLQEENRFLKAELTRLKKNLGIGTGPIFEEQIGAGDGMSKTEFLKFVSEVLRQGEDN